MDDAKNQTAGGAWSGPHDSLKRSIVTNQSWREHQAVIRCGGGRVGGMLAVAMIFSDF